MSRLQQLDSPLGYFSAQPGQTLKDGTWPITCKLGWGPQSSTWLVIDKNDQHRALKILTAAAAADRTPKTKNVIGDISNRLADIATQNIIDGVTPDNFLFFSFQWGDDVRKALAKVPADKPVKIQGSDGVPYPTVRLQPIPNHYTSESKANDIAYTIFSLAKLTHARQTTATTLDTPKNIQPPEALTGGKNLTYTSLLLTGKPLFAESYVASPVKVAQETLGKVESLLTENLASTAKFLRMCLSINIANMATALEVLEGGWIMSGCACGWRG
ncbi:hypothetical protein K443DRAFT_682540 [Laccaria amethystina LaAM-08-1]|uniref:Uncharacterized protein n=1 Tax=Laccaria amethystina LaAM-08-1 TaxID=1095629 RepID=A0A0C9XIQ5_9AGAR|nr:hypothetical protein K443DRAFT_682540 [Laccaria amethystina LaAM-08-1]